MCLSRTDDEKVSNKNFNLQDKTCTKNSKYDTQIEPAQEKHTKQKHARKHRLRRLLRHPARKRSGCSLATQEPTRGDHFDHNISSYMRSTKIVYIVFLYNGIDSSNLHYSEMVRSEWQENRFSVNKNVIVGLLTAFAKITT